MAAPDDFTAAWAALEAGKVALADVRFETMSSTSTGTRWLAVYGPSVGLWDRERQFVTSEGTLKAALELFRKAGFSSMPDLFGWKRAPVKPAPKEPAATQRLRAATLLIGGVGKTVSQVDKGEQSKELTTLVDGLFALYEKEASTGVTATDLADALAKVRRGELSPALLVLRVNCPPSRPSGGTSTRGWLLQIKGGWADTQVVETGRARPPLARHKLSAKQLGRIVAALNESHFATLPINIVDPGYTDLSVTMLQHDRAIQARQFAGKLASRKPEDVQAFGRIRGVLEEVLKELTTGR